MTYFGFGFGSRLQSEISLLPPLRRIFDGKVQRLKAKRVNPRAQLFCYVGKKKV